MRHALKTGDAPPDGYEGRWFSSKELTVANRELKKLGRRICRVHQGAALPLDETHFYRCFKGLYFEHVCIDCRNQGLREHYAQDSAYADSERKRAVDYYLTHGVNERRQRRKFARVLMQIGDRP